MSDNCTICRLSDQNVLECGEWKTSEDVNIHHFCALLSADLPQSGGDDDGIDGFLLNDIRQYAKVRSKRTCSYCKKKYASIRCAEKRCTRWWHPVCSVKNKCLPIFEDDHNSYCHRHVQITEKCPRHQDSVNCQICQNPMGAYHPVTSIPSCCIGNCKAEYYHRNCMQKNAYSSGYLTKCPSCGEDADGYRKFLRTRGIFCPDKDADWELTPAAYDSLLYVHKRCDAAECLCRSGRKFVGRENSKWKLLTCDSCGGKGVHVGCRYEAETGTEINEKFLCDDCHIMSAQSVIAEAESMNVDIFDVDGAFDDGPSVRAEKEEAADPGLTIPRRNRTQTQEKRADANKVWKLVDTNKTAFRKQSLHLVDLNEATDDDPLSDDERNKMRQSRMDMFFRMADFNAKPAPPPWLL